MVVQSPSAREDHSMYAQRPGICRSRRGARCTRGGGVFPVAQGKWFNESIGRGRTKGLYDILKAAQ